MANVRDGLPVPIYIRSNAVQIPRNPHMNKMLGGKKREKRHRFGI